MGCDGFLHASGLNVISPFAKGRVSGRAVHAEFNNTYRVLEEQFCVSTEFHGSSSNRTHTGGIKMG